MLEPGDQGDQETCRIKAEWAEWDPGVRLVVLRTEYASVVEPIVGYIDDQCQGEDEQLVVLIPTVMPSRIRYRLLHNHLDLVLSAALRSHPEVVVARVTMPLEHRPDGHVG